LVIIDMGSFVDGFASDMTRTLSIGPPSAEGQRVYEAVLEAQEAALAVARAGLTTTELDAAARTSLAKHGLAEAFAHGLGHGLGLEIHEWPRLSQNTRDVLPENCVVTIEPGVYLPGRLGVRIEDVIVLRPDGFDNLTASPKELIVV
jgi:Xaa-Pro aminopeptidase